MPPKVGPKKLVNSLPHTKGSGESEKPSDEGGDEKISSNTGTKGPAIDLGNGNVSTVPIGPIPIPTGHLPTPNTPHTPDKESISQNGPNHVPISTVPIPIGHLPTPNTPHTPDKESISQNGPNHVPISTVPIPIGHLPTPNTPNTPDKESISQNGPNHVPVSTVPVGPIPLTQPNHPNQTPDNKESISGTLPLDTSTRGPVIGPGRIPPKRPLGPSITKGAGENVTEPSGLENQGSEGQPAGSNTSTQKQLSAEEKRKLREAELAGDGEPPPNATVGPDKNA